MHMDTLNELKMELLESPPIQKIHHEQPGIFVGTLSYLFSQATIRSLLKTKIYYIQSLSSLHSCIVFTESFIHLSVIVPVTKYCLLEVFSSFQSLFFQKNFFPASISESGSHSTT